MRPFVDDIFRSQGEWIRIYTGIEEIQDPFEKNVTTTYINPLPIQALVSDFTSTQAMWKMPGVKVSKIKEIFIKSKYRRLIELSSRIEIDGEFYEGWKENGKMQIREMAQDVIRLYVYSKAV